MKDQQMTKNLSTQFRILMLNLKLMNVYQILIICRMNHFLEKDFRLDLTIQKQKYIVV